MSESKGKMAIDLDISSELVKESIYVETIINRRKKVYKRRSRNGKSKWK